MFIIPSEEGKFSEGITKATTERGVIVGSYHGKEIKLNMKSRGQSFKMWANKTCVTFLMIIQ